MLLDYIKSLLRPRPRPTWDEVLAEYLQSSDFRDLSPASQKPYRRVLVRWLQAERLGLQPVAALTRRELEAMLSRRSKGAANFLFKRVRVLLRFAKARGYRSDDPTIDIKCKPIGGEHATWTDEEIEQYRAYWRLGTSRLLNFATGDGASRI